MRKFLSVLIIFIGLVLMNGPPVYSIDLSTDDVVITSVDVDIENNYDFTVAEDILVFEDSRELITVYYNLDFSGLQTLQTITMNYKIQVERQNPGQLLEIDEGITDKCLLIKTLLTSNLNMVNNRLWPITLLEQNNVYMGLSRLDIGEYPASQSYWQTCM